MTGTSKNILIIGHTDHGKSTLIEAFKRVLSYRYGIGNDLNDSSIMSMEESKTTPPFECEIDDLCIRLIHLGFNEDYETYIPKHAHQLDAAILVCSYLDGIMSGTKRQCELCAKHNIPIACVYFSKCQNFDKDLFSLIEESVLDLVKNKTSHKTAALTETLIKDRLEVTGVRFHKKSCPTYAGDSLDAIAHPLDKNATLLIRMLNCIRVAVS